MRLFLFFSFIILLPGCTSIEVAKEVTKATASIKTSITNVIKLETEKIIEGEDPKKLEKENSKEGKSADVVDLKEYKMRKAMMFE